MNIEGIVHFLEIGENWSTRRKHSWSEEECAQSINTEVRIESRSPEISLPIVAKFPIFPYAPNPLQYWVFLINCCT